MTRGKDYKPLTFSMPKGQWKAVARLLGGNIRNDIEHKLLFHPFKLDFFQTDMEKIMYALEGTGYNRSKEALQMEINKYIESGDWI